MDFAALQTWLLGALLAVAAGHDLCTRRVPNRLVLTIAGIGCAAQLATRGPWAALEGVGCGALALGALWLAWCRRWLGGGDVKLAVAIATWFGLAELPTLALASALATGATAALCYALSSVLARREVRRNLVGAAYGLGVSAPVSAEGGRVTVPAGAALAVGALAAIAFGRITWNP